MNAKINAPLPRLALLAGWLFAASPMTAQQPVLSYLLSVDTNNYSTVQVAIRLRNLPPIFHLAMARHFLAWTDNAPWTNVNGLEVTGGTITREVNRLWRVSAPGTGRNDKRPFSCAGAPTNSTRHHGLKESPREGV